MNEEIIITFIKSLLEDNKVVYTHHAKLRMMERRISVDDVTDILANPMYIHKETESESFKGKYNYRVVGKHGWSVVVSVHYPSSIVVVTVID